MTVEEIEIEADKYALEESTACNYGEASKHVYRGYFYGFKTGAEFGYNKAKEEDKELKEENEKSNVLLSDIIEAFTSRSYNDDFEMAQAGREIYELFYGGKDPKEVFHNAEVPKCSRQLLKEAKDLIKNIIRVTWGEGWNYDLGWKVEAEKFLKECEE